MPRQSSHLQWMQQMAGQFGTGARLQSISNFPQESFARVGSLKDKTNRYTRAPNQGWQGAAWGGGCKAEAVSSGE